MTTGITPAWEVKSEKARMFHRKRGAGLTVIIDCLAVPMWTSSSLTSSSGRHAHILFRRDGGTLGRLCNTREVMLQGRGWQAVKSNVEVWAADWDRAHTERPKWQTVSSSVDVISFIGSYARYRIGGWPLCDSCWRQFNYLAEITYKKRNGKPEEERKDRRHVTSGDAILMWIGDHQDIVNAMDDEALASFLTAIRR